MVKGMGLCLCIAHVCLDRIVSTFGFNVYEYESMNMCCLNVLCERFFSHICIHTYMNDDLVNSGALKSVLMCILN